MQLHGKTKLKCNSSSVLNSSSALCHKKKKLRLILILRFNVAKHFWCDMTWPPLYHGGLEKYIQEQSSSTPTTQIGEKKQTEQERETRSTCTQGRERERERGDKRRGWITWRTIQTSGVRDRVRGESLRSQDVWWSSTEKPEWKETRERGRGREITSFISNEL